MDIISFRVPLMLGVMILITAIIEVRFLIVYFSSGNATSGRRHEYIPSKSGYRMGIVWGNFDAIPPTSGAVNLTGFGFDCGSKHFPNLAWSGQSTSTR